MEAGRQVTNPRALGRRTVLAGSLGGLLAWAMAQEARADDQETVFVATIDGKALTATRTRAGVVHLGARPVLNITATFVAERTSILGFNLLLTDMRHPSGTYQLQMGRPDKVSHGAWTDGNETEDPVAARFEFETGELVIADTEPALTGTFKGQLKSLSGDRRITVTDGKFSGLMPD